MNLIDKVISLTDFPHIPLPLETGAEQHKEWHHFCILSNEVQLIVNLSVMRAPWDSDWLARLILLVREKNWDGDVDTFHSVESTIKRGKLDMQLGHNVLQYRNGCYVLSLALEKRPITLLAQVKPVAYPLIRNNMPIGSGKINWVVIPRLETSGSLVIGRRVYQLENAPTYHDHNWGSWSWGDDFSWQWGFALPESQDGPWSVIFDHMADRGCNRSLELKMSLWKDSQICRLFMHEEIQMKQEGFIDSSSLSKFPRPMTLISPELTTNVPQRFEIVARSQRDWLQCCFTGKDLAQIIIPNENDLGITIINEVFGELDLSGVVKGQTVNMRGKSFFEFLT